LNQVFLFVSDVNVLFRDWRTPGGGSFTNSTLRVRYAGFATKPVAFGVTVFSGEFAADGAPHRQYDGAEDIGARADRTRAWRSIHIFRLLIAHNGREL